MRVNILVKYTPCICLLLYISRIRLLAFSICLTSSVSLPLFLPLCLLLVPSSSASYAASVDCVSTFCLTFNSFHFCGSHCTSDSSSTLLPLRCTLSAAHLKLFLHAAPCCAAVVVVLVFSKGLHEYFAGIFIAFRFYALTMTISLLSLPLFFLFLLRCCTLAGAWKAYSDDNATTCSKGQTAEILCNILWLSTVSSGRGRGSSRYIYLLCGACELVICIIFITFYWTTSVRVRWVCVCVWLW